METADRGRRAALRPPEEGQGPLVVKASTSILILSPWPSIFSMAGGGTPLGRDLLETLLAAGYSVDFVAPEAEEGDWFPNDERIRVHRYRRLRLTFAGSPGRVIAWLERTIRVTLRGLIVAIR